MLVFVMDPMLRAATRTPRPLQHVGTSSTGRRLCALFATCIGLGSAQTWLSCTISKECLHSYVCRELG